MKRAIFTTVCVVCAALRVLAAELEFSANGEGEYDNNVFRTNTNKEDDGLFRIRPGVRIHEDRGDDLNFSASYQAPIELSIKHSSELNEVDHIGDGNFDYHVNDRLSFFGSEHYGYIRSTLRNQIAGTDQLGFTVGAPTLNDQRDRVQVNNASLGGLYRFSPRTVSQLNVTSSYFDSSRDDRATVYTIGADADLTYRLTLKHQLGAGVGYIFQDFSNTQDIPGSQTNTYRVFGSWRWDITPKLTFDINGGPAFLETKQDDTTRLRSVQAVPFTVINGGVAPPNFPLFDKNQNLIQVGTAIGPGSLLLASINNCGTINGVAVASACNGNILVNSNNDSATVGAVLNDVTPVFNINSHGQTQSDLTGFVDAVMTQRWSQSLATALHYSRTQGDASGLGGTVIVDAVSLVNTWTFLDRWQFALRGDWARRTSAFDQRQTFDVVDGQVIPGGAVLIATRTGIAFNSTHNVNIDTDNWSVGGRITHDLFKSTSIYAQLRYSEQSSRSNTLGTQTDFTNFLATVGVRHVFEPIPLW